MERTNKKKWIIVSIITLLLLIIVGIFVWNAVSPSYNYIKAVDLYENKEYAKAAIAFGKLYDYKDSRKRSLDAWEKVVRRETIDVGGNHSVAIKEDGDVVAAGMNDHGQCGVSNWTDVVSISAGDTYTVGLKSDGTVVTIGHLVREKSDGTYVAVVDDDGGQSVVSDWTNIKLLKNTE